MIKKISLILSMTIMLLACTAPANQGSDNNNDAKKDENAGIGKVVIRLPKVELTRANPADIRKYTVTLVGNGETKKQEGKPGDTITFEKVVIGNYAVSVDAYDDTGLHIYESAPVDVVVEPNKTATAKINLVEIVHTGEIVIDISFSNDTNANIIKTIETQSTPHGFDIKDGIVYIANLYGNMQVFDINDFNNVIEKPLIKARGADVDIIGKYAFLNGYDIEIHNLDLSEDIKLFKHDITNLVPLRFNVCGNSVFFGDFFTQKIYEYNTEGVDYAALFEISELNISSQAVAYKFTDNLAIIIESDAANKEHMILMDRLNNYTEISRINIEYKSTYAEIGMVNDCIFVPLYDSGFQIYNINDPNDIKLLKTVLGGKGIDRVAEFENYIITANDEEVQIIDLSNPDNIQIINTFYGLGRISDIYPSQEYLYISVSPSFVGDFSGLKIIKDWK